MSHSALTRRGRWFAWTCCLLVTVVHYFESLIAWYDIPGNGFYTKAAEAPRYDFLWPWLSQPVAALFSDEFLDLHHFGVLAVNSVVAVGLATWLGVKAWRLSVARRSAR